MRAASQNGLNNTVIFFLVFYENLKALSSTLSVPAARLARVKHATPSRGLTSCIQHTLVNQIRTETSAKLLCEHSDFVCSSTHPNYTAIANELMSPGSTELTTTGHYRRPNEKRLICKHVLVLLFSTNKVHYLFLLAVKR